MSSTYYAPDSRGRYGSFGGSFLPETLITPVAELATAYEKAKADPQFQATLTRYLTTYVGRETPLTFAERLSAQVGGPRIYLKREDLAHTGAHKINNALGQALLAKQMGKRRLVAETGAGQHGVASATVAALLNLECVVYMGEEDMARQAINVSRMELLGAQVVPVSTGTKTLKDAISEAMRDWASSFGHSHYLLGSALGPHPYPLMVRDFQSVIGLEARAQILAAEGRLPDRLVACVGGGSNAIGLFYPFINDKSVEMVGVEAGGRSSAKRQHAARFATGSPGVLHGSYTYCLQDEQGQIEETHSISAGLDYAAVGPEHCHLREIARATYASASDEEALSAFQTLCALEGILPALESSHALAYVLREGGKAPVDQIWILNLSGRGDKDLARVLEILQSRKEAPGATR